MNTACDHKKTGIFKNKDGECKEDKYKCKEVMHCKKCKSREEIFLSETLYKKQQKIIEQEVGNV